MVRREVTDRFYRVFTYQDVDRAPDLEFGYWPQTIRPWLGEGLPLELEPEETSEMFSQKVDDSFGLELRLRGGIAKRPLVEGGTAIDSELERARPLLEQGGYLPHLDHLVPQTCPTHTTASTWTRSAS